MKNLFELENKYLLAKVMYYKGTPIMTDAEFDALEAYLKSVGSKVVNQVGEKLIDYDFVHPTPMLSLGKSQIEATDDGTDYMVDDFEKWFNKRLDILGKDVVLETSPKYDGNAVNVIYIGGKLNMILTRGSGTAGNYVNDKLTHQIPDTIKVAGIELKDTDVVEIRCEVVIETNFFNKKYGDEFANPRNYVAGVIRSEDDNKEQCDELTVLPLHYILNGEHLSHSYFRDNDFVAQNTYNKSMVSTDYVDIIQWYENLRETFIYQLDGVVISFPAGVRDQLGENSHDPEWAIAIKFVPEEATTPLDGFKLFIGKTGEFTPVLQLVPVQLAGTTVQRASGYNFGYIVNNKLGKGAIVSIAKAGDIIPEVQSVIVPSDEEIEIPTHCPHCNSELTFDGIHLMCNNTRCEGRIAKQLASNSKFISIKGIGPKTLENFACDFEDLVDLIVWTRTNGSSSDIEKYGITNGSRSHELFLNAFNNIKVLTYGQVIVLMSYNNVGLKLAEQVANMYTGNDADFAGHDRSIVEMFKDEDVKSRIQSKIESLVSVGIEVEVPVQKEITSDSLFVCMTGSPKPFGFATKKVFTELIGDKLNEVSITSKDCQYLITDDLNSKSSKMKNAEKKGIKIVTYGDFVNKFGN